MPFSLNSVLYFYFLVVATLVFLPPGWQYGVFDSSSKEGECLVFGDWTGFWIQLGLLPHYHCCAISRDYLDYHKTTNVCHVGSRVAY